MLHQRLFTTVIAKVFLYVCFLSFIQAQCLPSPVTKPQYMTLNGVLYIQGGIIGLGTVAVTSNFYALDLTPVFNEMSPPRRTLATSSGTFSAPQQSERATLSSLDQKNLLIWNGQHITY